MNRKTDASPDESQGETIDDDSKTSQTRRSEPKKTGSDPVNEKMGSDPVNSVNSGGNPVPLAVGELSLDDHRQLMAQLDELLAQVGTLMERFEATGYEMAMRDDYVALHRLQRRILDERRSHSDALGLPPYQLTPGGGATQ